MVFLGIEALHTEQRKILRAAWWDSVKEAASVAGLAQLNGGVIPCCDEYVAAFTLTPVAFGRCVRRRRKEWICRTTRGAKGRAAAR